MKDNLIKIIDEANLSAFERSLWLSFINMSDEKILKDLWEEIKDDPEALMFFTKNMTDKIRAYRESDSSLWNKISEDEKQFLGAT
jgi:hypothetical protein